MARRALAGLLLILVLAAGVLGKRWLTASRSSSGASGQASAEASANPNPRRTASTTTTLEVKGIVERRSNGGAWIPLEIGTHPDISDEIRTGPGSRARLQLGDQVTVELADNTGINIAQLSETLSRVRLQDGRVVSEVRAKPGFLFRVQVQGNNSEAETGAGRFAVLKRGNSPAAFAAEQGGLVVTGAGQSVTLAAGEQTQVVANSAPSAPTKLPSSLLLKLGKPPPSRMRIKQAQISGETSAGAVVSVGDQLAIPNRKGQFTSTIALVDGPNEIIVQVEDVLGRRQTARVPKITVDAHAPRVVGKVVW